MKFLADAWAARRGTTRRARAEIAEWPRVTVQLPIYNELAVAERVMRATARLDYPADRLEIQVLDDSDDETRALVDATAKELARSGVDIRVLRRGDRRGFKAGNLASGLSVARGEVIAIFDADSVPPADFLRETVPLLMADPRAGMVQGRWDFDDADRSLLARCQALVLDGLMLVEQPAKAATDRPLHFNGTAGVWRKACIDDAGGWSGASITEDLELSYRATLKGWRLLHAPDVAVTMELPQTMGAYRVQQQRWTRGNGQVLRAMAGRVLSSDLPFGDRFAMVSRAGGRVLYVFLAILSITMPLSTFRWMPVLVEYGPVADGATLAAVVLAFHAFYLPAQLRARRPLWRAVTVVPLVMALHVGLSFSCAFAFLVGFTKRSAEFVRTPKTGGAKSTRHEERVPFDAFAILEIAIAGAYVGFAGLALKQHLHLIAAFFVLWAASFAWTGGSTLLERLSSPSRAPLEPPVARDAATSLESELARARRDGKEVALLLVSIAAEDGETARTLRVVHRAVMAGVRACDDVFDIDPTRIAVLLPDAAAGSSETILSRVRDQVKLALDGEKAVVRVVHVAASAPSETAESLIRRAEELLRDRE
jgi:cellulose synthase/poly-beta-1,6-N-acetylglucosamine synthase-like glycosyltransferase